MHIGYFIIGKSSNPQTTTSEEQQTDTTAQIRRDCPPCFDSWWDTQVRFDTGAFYESVYQYVCFHIKKRGIVIPIPRKKSLKTLSVYRVLLTHEMLKQIHQKNLYVDIDDPDDEVLAILKACVEAAEHRLPENLSKNGWPDLEQHQNDVWWET